MDSKKIVAAEVSEYAGRGWTMATPEDLLRMVATVRRDLGAIKDQAKKYEAELTSRDWKV